MLSVTRRVEMVSQPKGGYVPKKLFVERYYHDKTKNNTIEDKHIYNIESAFTGIQGMAVDYITRYIMSGDKEMAFDIPIKGAKCVDKVYENDYEYNKIMQLLDNVKGTDDVSVYNVCKIVGYDVAFRRGVSKFRNVDDILPTKELVYNIQVMVQRCIEFIDNNGPLVLSDFTFEGGYTKLVSSGDGDYLTRNTLIDFKVSKQTFSTKWSLQVLMYYILGIHSVYREFDGIKYLCIYNPLKNMSYTVCLNDIKDEIKYRVSHDVIGYKMVYPDSQAYHSLWNITNGTDPEIVRKYRNNCIMTDFDINKYDDGIYNISINDYWTYLRSIDVRSENDAYPMFKYTDHVIMLKRKKYVMFFSVSPKGKLAILNGAERRIAEFSIEYYYDYIERYAKGVKQRFSKYWDAIYNISEQLKSLKPSSGYLRKNQYSDYVFECNKIGINPKSFNEWVYGEKQKYRISGKVHGCIVDIDYFNHIYLNPQDGKITPYFAVSMYDKDVYENVEDMLMAKRPEMLESYQKYIACNTKSRLAIATSENNSGNKKQYNVMSAKYIKDYSYNIYKISNRIKLLQNIYTDNLVQIWYDEILNEDVALLDDKYKIVKPLTGSGDKESILEKMKRKYIGQKRKQKGGRMASIIGYRSNVDIDVSFDDGYKMENVRLASWKNGCLRHPDVVIHKQAIKTNVLAKEKYIGMERIMNCGLKATVIDYKDCKNLTIKFEDGCIREHIRSDHFMDGRVQHLNQV